MDDKRRDGKGKILGRVTYCACGVQVGRRSYGSGGNLLPHLFNGGSQSGSPDIRYATVAAIR
jgi:hypothetical protein